MQDFTDATAKTQTSSCADCRQHVNVYASEVSSEKEKCLTLYYAQTTTHSEKQAMKMYTSPPTTMHMLVIKTCPLSWCTMEPILLSNSKNIHIF